MANRVPLLAGGDDLWWQRGDPAQHHRPSTARPRERAVIDGAALELFERSVGHALDRHTGAALDAALAELGWHDALATDQRVAVSTLFTRQGAANATSSALDW